MRYGMPHECITVTVTVQSSILGRESRLAADQHTQQLLRDMSQALAPPPTRPTRAGVRHVCCALGDRPPIACRSLWPPCGCPVPGLQRSLLRAGQSIAVREAGSKLFRCLPAGE